MLLFKIKLSGIKVPILTYPDCELCSCSPDSTTSEDIGEDVYEIDRLLNQLKLAGIFDNLAGFIFGQCSNCSADSNYGSLTLEEVIREYIQPLKIPACLGLMIGHLEIIETIAIGIEVEFDANRGTITMLESAVSKP